MIRIPDRDNSIEPGNLSDETVPKPLTQPADLRDPTSGSDEMPDIEIEATDLGEPRFASGPSDETCGAEDAPEAQEQDLGAERDSGSTEPEEADDGSEELQAAAFEEISESELELASPGKETVEVPTFPKDMGQEDLTRLRRTIEALLFASTEALSPARLSEVVGVSVALVRDALDVLQEELDRDERPYRIQEHGGCFRLYTRQEYYPFLLRLRSLKKVEKLTPAALETLAIVAYRQPVIRSEVEAIRGVKVGPMLRALLDRKLVRVLGRAEVPGAPLQYGTTQSFLDRFGLKALSELPSLKEFKQGRI